MTRGSEYGMSPLMQAALDGNEALLDALLARGATVDHEDVYGRTALVMACNRRRTGCVQRLLSAGADPNRPDRDGWVPLMRSGNLAILRALLEAGADPRYVAPDGWSVWEALSRRREALQMLEQHGAPPDNWHTPRIRLAIERDLRSAGALLSPQMESERPLHCAWASLESPERFWVVTLRGQVVGTAGIGISDGQMYPGWIALTAELEAAGWREKLETFLNSRLAGP